MSASLPLDASYQIALTYTSDNQVNHILNLLEPQHTRNAHRELGRKLRGCSASDNHVSASTGIHPLQRHFGVFKTHSLAKTPLNAAHAPLATAKTIHWFRCAQLRSSRGVSALPAAVLSPSNGRSSSDGPLISAGCCSSLADFVALFWREGDGSGEMEVAVAAFDGGDKERAVDGASDWRLRGRSVGIV